MEENQIEKETKIEEQTEVLEKVDEKIDESVEKKHNDSKFIKVHKKTIIIALSVILVLVLVYICKGFFVVATVNGSPISRFSIINKLEKESGKNTLESMITQKLVQNEIKNKKIVVSEDEVSAELKKVEEQIKSTGGDLNSALEGQGMTLSDLKEQIKLQKQAEKLFVDKINVTDEEVKKYIEDNKITVPKEQEQDMIQEIKTELGNQKLGTEIQTLIKDLREKANIKYFVKY